CAKARYSTALRHRVNACHCLRELVAELDVVSAMCIHRWYIFDAVRRATGDAVDSHSDGDGEKSEKNESH
ncbi:hypothetical protein PENTCL1PPCAC_24403, partial [Pristionchus entomophagus]